MICFSSIFKEGFFLRGKLKKEKKRKDYERHMNKKGVKKEKKGGANQTQK